MQALIDFVSAYVPDAWVEIVSGAALVKCTVDVPTCFERRGTDHWLSEVMIDF